MEDVGKAHFFPDKGAGSAVRRNWPNLTCSDGEASDTNDFAKCVLAWLSSCIVLKRSFGPISLVNLRDIFDHFQNHGTLTSLFAFRWSTYPKLGRAIENGSNALAEGFLFAVAASLIIGETWRSSRNQSKRRDAIDDQIDGLGTGLAELNSRVDTLTQRWEEELSQERQR